jgi:cell division protein FtsW (lipid II flippase)
MTLLVSNERLGLDSARPGRVLLGASWLAVQAAAVAIVAGVLTLWWWAALDLASRQKPAAMLGSIRIAAPQRSEAAVITLGRGELLQNDVGSAAAERHIKILRSGDGTWRIGNASTNRQLFLRYGDDVSYLASRQLLREGAVIALAPRQGSAFVTVTSLTATTLHLRVAELGAGRAERISDYALTLLHGELAELCREGGTRLCLPRPGYGAGAWLKAQLGPGSERVIARIGGPVMSRDKGPAVIPVDGYGYDSVRIVHIPGRGFALAPGVDRFVEFQPAGTGPRLRFIDILHDASVPGRPQLKGFTAGRTTYEVSFTAEGMTIRPTGGAHLYRGEKGEPLDTTNPVADLATDLLMFRADRTERGQIQRSNLQSPDLGRMWSLSASVSRLIPPLSRWSVAMMVTWLVSLVIIVAARLQYAVHERTRSGQTRLMAGLFARSLGSAALLAVPLWMVPILMAEPPMGGPSDPLPALIAWAAAGVAVMLAFQPLASLLFAIATCLIGAGSYVLLAMGLSSDELRWTRFHNEMTAGMAFGAAAIIGALALPQRLFLAGAQALARPGRLGMSLGVGVVVGCIIALGGLWFGFGSEGGIAGFFQPSEMIKTLYVILVAAIGVLIQRRRFGGAVRPSGLSIVAPLVVATGVLACALMLPVLNGDFSPFLILALTLLCSLPLIVGFDIAARWARRLTASVRTDLAPAGPPDERSRSIHLPLPGLMDKLAAWRRSAWRRLRSASVMEVIIFVCVPVLVVVAFERLVTFAGANPRAAQVFMQDMTPSKFEKLVPRVSSWLELQLPPTVDGGGSSSLPIIDHPDVGQQVIRSRRAVAAAPCRLLADPSGAVAAQRSGLASWAAVPASLATDVWRMLGFMPAECAGGATSAPLPPVTRLGIPEVQNDFILPWAFTVLGKDGALLLLTLQAVFCVMLLVTAFRIMRWSPANEETRAAASFYANMTICLFLMVTLQFMISWMNAFGLLPVMGQPMTYLSQGRSHFLFFGVAVILVPIIGLRCLAERGPAPESGLPRIAARWPFRRRPGSRIRLSRDAVSGAQRLTVGSRR